MKVSLRSAAKKALGIFRELISHNNNNNNDNNNQTSV